MARDKKKLANQVDFTHLFSIGFFAKIVPKTLIDEVLELTGRASKRVRLLPAAAVVYFVMAMSIYREPSLEEIIRIFTECVRQLSQDLGNMPMPNKSAISQARRRLGSEPMRLIADKVLKPIAPPDYPGAWYKGMRLMSIDGSCFDTPDETENASYFGYPSASRGESAFPQVRVVSLVETGTRAVTAAEMGPYNTSELSLTHTLLENDKLTSEMLLLADRHFFGYRLWAKAISTGAKLVWRTKVNLKHPVLKNLPDGSFISIIHDSRDKTADPIEVRVIEYKLNSGDNSDETIRPAGEKYRLLTNIFDHELAPAKELAALYHERWEIETLFREFKNVLHSANTVLRSKTPDLIKQELWGLILVHFCLKDLMAESAWHVNLDSDELSFKHAMNVMRRKLPLVAAFPPR